MRTLCSVVPSPEAREFVGLIHRRNPDPRVAAWFVEAMIEGRWVYASLRVTASEVRTIEGRASGSENGDEQRLF